MPLSKNNTLYFTAEQKEKADQNSNALQYALSQGYDLVQHGNYYTMREHDSMVFKLDGSWFWNSQRLHGRAQEFIMHYENRSLVEAVLILAGEIPGRGLTPPILPRASPPVPFQLPPKSNSQRQLYGYLCGTRKLAPQIVKAMTDQKILYQTDYQTAQEQVIHNVCFVSYDDQGKPCSAFKRGTATFGPAYKREVAGGDKQYGWILHGNSPKEVYIFEAAIDAASYATLKLQKKEDPFQNVDYMALGGLNFTPISNYLKNHPDIKEIHLMLDNDDPGRNASQDFASRLQQEGFKVSQHLPPSGKDWNAYLQNSPEIIEEKGRSAGLPEATSKPFSSAVPRPGKRKRPEYER